MRRRLIVMRHAKSSWKSDAPDDHSRPLNKRGRRDAPIVGARLQEIGWAPEIIFSSDSARTKQTLELMLKHFDPAPAIEHRSTLYQGGIHEIRETVATAGRDVATVLVLGHNPGWQHAVTWLSGEDIEMTTANAALLECSGDTWRETLHAQGGWHLVDVIRPKALLGAG